MRPSMKVNAPPPMKLSALVVEEEVVAMEVEVVEEVSLNMGGGREMLTVVEDMVVEDMVVEAVDLEVVALEGVAVQGEAIQLLQEEEEEEVEEAIQHHQEATQHPPVEAEVAIPPPWGGGSLFPPLEVAAILILDRNLDILSASNACPLSNLWMFDFQVEEVTLVVEVVEGVTVMAHLQQHPAPDIQVPLAEEAVVEATLVEEVEATATALLLLHQALPTLLLLLAPA